MAEIDLTPPVAAAKAAEQGLKLREQHKRGGTRIGVARARQLIKRAPLSADVVKRMASYFARHEVDKKGKDFDNAENPSAGFIAWQLWGGDAGRDWAEKKKAELAEKS
ncbi:hypothetical protein ASG72_03715 [Bosea sp. Leaf344]|uniref:hypothetical protein n=1 Tax=Bosea sp. Leaf344 TaxID=1736346 RepID=UPI0007001893|nr:hypothetical protein [Bosea sp. Leaf344]KQU54734.1 hypothetical protein ASG72_03715 [Bosea sp. Leaf344]